jgi:hypothetical protein
MKMRIGLVLIATTVAAIAARTFRSARPADRTEQQRADAAGASDDVKEATRRFMLYVLLPLWMVPGFGDYLSHRTSDIEHTSGTHESLTHGLMIASTGAGIAVGLFCEIEKTAIAVMAAMAGLHEAVVLWDVAYAVKRRPPSATEQHLHSFLEVLPFTALAFMCCLHPDAVAELAGRRPSSGGFGLRLRSRQESPLYLAAIFALSSLCLVIPYAEEFGRCIRVDGTVLPHPENESG